MNIKFKLNENQVINSSYYTTKLFIAFKVINYSISQGIPRFCGRLVSNGANVRGKLSWKLRITGRLSLLKFDNAANKRN